MPTGSTEVHQLCPATRCPINSVAELAQAASICRGQLYKPFRLNSTPILGRSVHFKACVTVRVALGNSGINKPTVAKYFDAY